MAFTCDLFGRRIRKAGPAGTMIYAYDGANTVAEYNAQGNAVALYTQGAGIDEPLASLTAAGTAFFEADGLGSVTSLSGMGGITDTYTYNAFGVTTATGSNPNRFRYTGREWDPETGLYYYRARYYDPQIGRFISEDPIHFQSGANFYLYVANRPVQLIDPLGLKSKPAPLDDILALQNLFPGSAVLPGPRVVIPMSCQAVRQVLHNQGYYTGDDVGSITLNPLNFWDPLYHAGGWEWRTRGPGLHFRMQYDRPNPFKKCPDESCTLDEFHVDDHNPLDHPLDHVRYDLLPEVWNSIRTRIWK